MQTNAIPLNSVRMSKRNGDREQERKRMQLQNRIGMENGLRQNHFFAEQQENYRKRFLLLSHFQQLFLINVLVWMHPTLFSRFSIHIFQRESSKRAKIFGREP